MNSILIFIMIWGSFISCDKIMPDQNPCELNPCDTTTLLGKLDTLWTIQINEDGSNPGTKRGIIIVDNQLIATFSNDAKSTIKSFSLSDSITLNWVWNDVNDNYVYTDYDPSTGLMVNKTWAYRSSINVNSGSSIEIVKSDQPSGPRGGLIGSQLYFYETNISENEAWLLKSSINNLSKVDTVYYLNNETIKNEKKTIESANLWIHPQRGDSILIFQHRMALPNRVDVLAWNIRTKEVVWRHDDLPIGKNSNHQQILIVNDKAYFGGGTAFYCFDIFDGEIVWQYNHPNGTNAFGLYKTAYAEAENKIIVKDAADKLFGFNALTGAVDWVRSDAGISSGGSGSPVYFNGIVYYTMQDLLWAVRASDGAILWSERSDKPFYKTSFRGDVAIDPERRVLYATDETRLFAIKLYGE